MKYIKPELDEIELLDPKFFVSCSNGGADVPDIPDEEEKQHIEPDNPGWD